MGRKAIDSVARDPLLDPVLGWRGIQINSVSKGMC